MRNLLKLAAMTSALALGGCTTPPDELSPLYVSPSTYSNLECPGLRGELEFVYERYLALHDELSEQASGDRAKAWVGGLLFWPTLVFIEGDDERKNEYRELLGMRDTLTRLIDEKC